MAKTKDWREMMTDAADLLERRTGDDVAAWNARIKETAPAGEDALRAWLEGEGVTGYPQMLLVFETFGYPPMFTATSDELFEAQYEGRPALRDVADEVIGLARAAGEDVTVQMRKTYVSLVGPRRTFAQVVPLKTRVDVGLRVDLPVGGRLANGRNLANRDCPVKLSLTSIDDVDDEVAALLEQAYGANL